MKSYDHVRTFSCTSPQGGKSALLNHEAKKAKAAGPQGTAAP